MDNNLDPLSTSEENGLDTDIVTQKKEEIIDWTILEDFTELLTLWEERIRQKIEGNEQLVILFNGSMKYWQDYMMWQTIFESTVLSNGNMKPVGLFDYKSKVRLTRKRVMELKKLYKRIEGKNTN